MGAAGKSAGVGVDGSGGMVGQGEGGLPGEGCIMGIVVNCRPGLHSVFVLVERGGGLPGTRYSLVLLYLSVALRHL